MVQDAGADGVNREILYGPRLISEAPEVNFTSGASEITDCRSMSYIHIVTAEPLSPYVKERFSGKLL